MSSLSLKSILLLTSMLVASLNGTVFAEPIREIVAFGDSLTDTGNAFLDNGRAFPPDPPYVGGRFTNGPVWIEYLADAIGIPRPLPSIEGGTNQAWGGAETGIGASTVGFLNINSQVYNYLAGMGGAIQNPETTLFVIWGGANDFLMRGELEASVPANNIAQAVSTLAAAGAKHFIVGNLPLLGQTPAGSTGVPSDFNLAGLPPEVLDDLAKQFNTFLKKSLEQVECLYEGIEVHRVNVYKLFKKVLNNPEKFGMTNVTTPFLTTGGNPNEFLFFDTIHPTTVFHHFLADDVIRHSFRKDTTAVPSPFDFGAVRKLRRRDHADGALKP